jgi:hypothetical protein
MVGLTKRDHFRWDPFREIVEMGDRLSGMLAAWQRPERSGRDASMVEIKEAAQGPIHLNLCLQSEDACQQQPWCPAYKIWWKRRMHSLLYCAKPIFGTLLGRASGHSTCRRRIDWVCYRGTLRSRSGGSKSWSRRNRTCGCDQQDDSQLCQR